jgi:hypothetical protein
MDWKKESAIRNLEYVSTGMPDAKLTGEDAREILEMMKGEEERLFVVEDYKELEGAADRLFHLLGKENNLEVVIRSKKKWVVSETVKEPIPATLIGRLSLAIRILLGRS